MRPALIDRYAQVTYNIRRKAQKIVRFDKQITNFHLNAYISIRDFIKVDLTQIPTPP